MTLRRRRRVVAEDVQEPVAEQPVEQVVVEEPKVEEPKVEEPKVEEPKVEEPVVVRKAAKLEESEEPVESGAKAKTRKRVGPAAAVEGILDLVPVLENMRVGEALTIRHSAEGVWEVTLGTFTPARPAVGGKSKRRGVPQAYWDEVLDPAYKQWEADWKQMGYEQKVAQAEQAGIEWERHPNPTMDIVRFVPILREKLGIEKYKAEYRDDATRNELRERYRNGEI